MVSVHVELFQVFDTGQGLAFPAPCIYLVHNQFRKVD
jgi:hypothetical protein